MMKTAKFRKKTIGKKNFGPKIDATDPCYDKDIYCRVDDLEIVPGEYSCVTWMYKDTFMINGKEYTDKRVGIIGIYLNGIIPTQKIMEEVGNIGVDAGVAGFFENKPDYTDEQWNKLCNMMSSDCKKSAWIIKEGFFSYSGYGDGGYPLYAHKDKKSGKYTALEIRFM